MITFPSIQFQSETLLYKLFLSSYMLMAITLPISEGLFQAAVALNFILIILQMKRWKESLISFSCSSIGVSIFLLILWWLFMMVFSKYTPLYSRATSNILSVFALFSGMCFVSIIYNRNEHTNFLKNIAITFSIVSVLCIVAGYYQFISGTFPYEKFFLPKNRSYIPQLYVPGQYLETRAVSGFFANRLKMAFFLTAPIFLLYPLIFQKMKSKFTKTILCITIIILVITQIFTYSRAAVIGTFFTFLAVAFFLLSKKQRNSFLIFVFAIFSFVPVFFHDFRNRFLSITSSEFFSDRLYIWKICKEMLFDFPLFGVGFGSFFSASNDYYPLTVPGHSPWRTSCHNDTVTIITTTGIIGFSLWLIFFFHLLKILFRVLKNMKNNESYESQMIITAASILISLGIQSLVHEVFFYPMTNLLFWFFCGITIHGVILFQSKPATARQDVLV